MMNLQVPDCALEVEKETPLNSIKYPRKEALAQGCHIQILYSIHLGALTSPRPPLFDTRATSNCFGLLELNESALE